MMNQLARRVQVFEHLTRIALMRRSEDDQLTQRCELLQQLNGVGADVHAGADDLSVGELYRQDYVRWHLGVFITVDECLIEVQNDGFVD
jgi:hypothetical protein